MSDRPLTAGEKALWQKFIETVKPLDQARVSRVKAMPVAKTLRNIPGPITARTFGGEPSGAVPLKDQVAVPTKHGLDGQLGSAPDQRRGAAGRDD